MAKKANSTTPPTREAAANLNSIQSGVDNELAEPKRGVGGTVSVACKIGVAWFDLQLCEAKEVQENTQTGPRTITQWVRSGKIVRVRGTSYPRGTPPEGFPAKPEMVGGYALTHNVSKEFYEAWEKQHAKAPYVINEMIFAADPSRIRAMCSERHQLKSGLEPVIPSMKDGTGKIITDPRVPRSTRQDVIGIETEDSRAAKMGAAVSTAE